MNEIAFSPDGKNIASASDDGLVLLWDVGNGKLERILKGHSGWVWSVAFSPNGRTIASAGQDGAVYLWDVTNGKLLRTFEDYIGKVQSAVFSHNDSFVVSANEDGTVRLWDAGPANSAKSSKAHRRRPIHSHRP